MDEPATKADLKRGVDVMTRRLSVMIALMVIALLVGVYVLAG